jgi:acetolactate synthase-1/2/3 large subunit
VPVHPEQTYYPKIGSRVLPNGGMESAPLDRMIPELREVDEKLVSELLGDR